MNRDSHSPQRNSCDIRIRTLGVLCLSALIPMVAIVSVVLAQSRLAHATAVMAIVPTSPTLQTVAGETTGPQDRGSRSGSQAGTNESSNGRTDDDQDDDEAAQGEAAEETKPPKLDSMALKRLSEQHRIWFDDQQKLVVVDGEVCLTRGQLEVFACPVGTKEHEAVVKVFSSAVLVHTALLRVGAKTGHPVRFGPYEAAEGTVIEVWVSWKDDEGNSRVVRAQEWVRNVATDEQLEHDWVFGGSGFWTDEETGERFYQGEGGELVCLSNFSTATMDLPIESTDANAGLLFEPFTERLPPRGTPLKMILRPRIPSQKDDANGEPTGDKGADDGLQDRRDDGNE